METPFGNGGRWRERLVDGLIVSGAALCASPAVHACLPRGAGELPDAASVWIALSTGAWTWLFLKVLRRHGLGHTWWLGPLLGMLNSGTACMFAFMHESQGLLDVGRFFLMGLLLGSMFGSFLGLLFGVAVAFVLWRLRKWERASEVDASLHLLGSASVAFAAIATLHVALDGVASPDAWRVPPQLSILIANGLALWAFVRHAHVAYWLYRPTSRFTLVGGVLTYQGEHGPFRDSSHAVGLVGSPLSYAVRAALLAALLATEVTLWML